MSSAWFYADSQHQQQGPVEDAWLVEAFRRGEVAPNTLVWREGFVGWVPFSRVASRLGITLPTAAAPPPPRRQVQIVKPQGSSTWVIVLLVVIFGFVAVVAVLAAIALPAYQDYTIRSQVSEGAVLADGAKTAVAEYFVNVGHFPADNASAGLAAPAAIHGNYVSSVAVDGGIITVRYSGTAPQRANPAIDGRQLTISPLADPKGSVRWICAAGSTTVPARYLPMSCRGRSN